MKINLNMMKKEDNFRRTIRILALRVETNSERDPRRVKIMKDERGYVSSLWQMQKPQRLSARTMP